MYPDRENMIVVPITKRIDIITRIYVCVISWMNFEYKRNGGSINIVYANGENMILVPTTKGMEIIMSVQD